MTSSKTKKKRLTPAVQARRKIVENPKRLHAVLDLYDRLVIEEGTGFKVSMNCDGVPKSMNGIWRINSGGRGYKVADAKVFERALFIRAVKAFSRPIVGTCAIIIAVETPLWLTQKNEIREMDIDNRIKSCIDAIKRQLGAGDHVVWEALIFKVQSNRERTHVWVYEFGDIVEVVNPLTP